MSNYRIYSPVDLVSTAATAPGQINIYNGTTNFTALRSPGTLTSNIPFVWDSSAPVTNDFIRTNGVGVLSFVEGLTSVLPLNMNLSGATAITPASSISTSFEEVGNFYWRGTPVEGTPSAVRVILSGNATGAEVRIIEVNTVGVAAIVTGLTLTATPTIYNVPITGGFNTVERTYRIEIRRTGAGTINIWSLQLKP